MVTPTRSRRGIVLGLVFVLLVGVVVGMYRCWGVTEGGFGRFAGLGADHPPLCWAKLGALPDGAGLATERLWS